ncbi:hypothetical protein D3C72_616310 [compost metagenome]
MFRLNKPPPQVPSNTSCTKSVGVPATLEIVNWCAVAVATNLYQTSSLGTPAPLSPSPESVAPNKVPEVLTPHNKLGFTVKTTAFVQSSFAGGFGSVLKLFVVQRLNSEPQLFLTWK